MNIYQAITAAMADVEPIAKGREPTAGFSFRGLINHERYSRLGGQKGHGLFVVPKVVDVIRQEKPNKVRRHVAVLNRHDGIHDVRARTASSITLAFNRLAREWTAGRQGSNKAMAVA